MRLVVLEDSPERARWFRWRFHACTVEVVRTVSEFRRAMEDRADFVFLDHDLGSREDGQDAARWMAQNMCRPPGLVFIHSTNPVGAVEMQLTLHSAGIPAQRVPFDGKWLTGGRDPFVLTKERAS